MNKITSSINCLLRLAALILVFFPILVFLAVITSVCESISDLCEWAHKKLLRLGDEWKFIHSPLWDDVKRDRRELAEFRKLFKQSSK